MSVNSSGLPTLINFFHRSTVLAMTAATLNRGRLA
ncbi:hypothetical protein PQC55_gp125 [Escherichia phage vB_EcoP-CHD5UKE1]|uniref:Uncharacterized protein n=1 Tax=Escherichia phage vB_EcoP-CHD5UKE1 TaxID=2865805 RepID=A0ABX9AJT2_9CAUD|nr:hypothetical protein PQC55_gp125 [Escherichia phage vB_EcoP-CHD5UKE1]QZI80633.1 hypothetical protein CHD5UKE1_137 [Escherichia phage vB_EcoP-CHD5UKE1]